MTTSSTPPSASDQRPTVLFVANTDWYLFNFRLNLLHAAHAAGWNVLLACPKRAYAKALEEEGFVTHHIPFDTIGFKPTQELNAMRALRRLAHRVRPQVFHLFTLKCVLYGSLAAPRGEVQTIGAVTGMGHLFTTRSWRTWLLKTPVLIALRRAIKRSRTQLVFQNDADRDEFVAYKIVDNEHTAVIRGSGVDCERFKPRPGRRSQSHVKLLFCGRLIAEKGIREYLAATARLRKSGRTFESQIAGAPYPGNPSSLSDAEVEKLQSEGSHIFLGQHEDMAALFADSDIVVLPTYREGTPKALLEAAASGCIIVTTDIPGCHGIADPGVNGHLVPPKKIAPIVVALAKILDATPQERQRMGAESRRIAVERFSDREVNAKTLTLYRQPAQTPPPS
ncbi:glycosyltransferase family 4 protein [Salinisphaera japonica]|nr:glycosyltransferase family 4 protein [Salinisphaera japonica]